MSAQTPTEPGRYLFIGTTSLRRAHRDAEILTLVEDLFKAEAP